MLLLEAGCGVGSEAGRGFLLLDACNSGRLLEATKPGGRERSKLNAPDVAQLPRPVYLVPKIHPKSLKNYSKINLGGILAGSWGLSAAKTEKDRGESVFWDRLGPVLAASWAVLAASWGRLGGLGGLLGPSWARLGGRNRTPSRPNIDPKNDQNFDAFGDRLFGRCWWIWGSKMEASWVQNRSKNRSQL